VRFQCQKAQNIRGHKIISKREKQEMVKGLTRIKIGNPKLVVVA